VPARWVHEATLCAAREIADGAKNRTIRAFNFVIGQPPIASASMELLNASAAARVRGPAIKRSLG